MPTGYTAPVVDGEVTTVKDFAALCARAFMWNMRDTSMDAPLRLPERNDSYYAEELPKALKELAEWDASSEEEKYAAWSEYAVRQEQAAVEAKNKAEAVRNRLQDMIDQIDKVSVPASHVNFRDFMVEQLRSTIEFDGSYNPDYYKVQNYVEWVESHRGFILRNIENCSSGLAKAEKNYQESREWVSTLASLYGLEIKG